MAGVTLQLAPMQLTKLSFRLCGLAGLLLGTLLTGWLTLHQGLSPWIELRLIAVAVGTLLATPLVIKVFTGRDSFVFYRDAICIFAAVSLTLRWMHQPLLPYLDVTIAGAGIFHACGRIGCLLAGCCFGRPCRLGVRYRHAHAQMGFPSALVGVRLFPIQSVEAVWILGLVGSVVLLFLRQGGPGSPFAFYVSAYAAGRFFFEFARGDAERPYWRGFSFPQWTSLLLAACVAAFASAHAIPHSNLHSGVAAFLALTMLSVAVVRRCQGTRRSQLLCSRHTYQMAEALQSPALFVGGSLPEINVSETFLGIRISAGEVPTDGRTVHHYCLSRRGVALSLDDARRLALQISRLRHDGAPFTLSEGRFGFAHIIVRGSQAFSPTR